MIYYKQHPDDAESNTWIVEEDYYGQLDETIEKANKFDNISESNARNGRKGWANISAEERSRRAKKAVEARIAKYGQKRRV